MSSSEGPHASPWHTHRRLAKRTHLEALLPLRGGDEYAEVAERVREGEVKIRRTMHISSGMLQRVDGADRPT